MHISRAGKKDVLSTKHFVLAIGAGSGQIPSMPELPGRVGIFSHFDLVIH